MNDVLDALTNKGVAVNVNVKLDSKTLLQLLSVILVAGLAILGVNYLLKNLSK